MTGEFPSQRASDKENNSIWWRRHIKQSSQYATTWTKNAYVGWPICTRHSHYTSKGSMLNEDTSCIWSDNVAPITGISINDDVIKWKHFPRYWSFVWWIHPSPLNFPHKAQWRGALMFSLICTWTKDWVNNRDAGDLRRSRALYDVIVMSIKYVNNIHLENSWTSMAVHVHVHHSSMHSPGIYPKQRIWHRIESILFCTDK